MYFTDPGPGWTRHLAGVRERLKPSGRPAQVSQHRPQLAGHSVPSPTHPWETSGTTQRHRDRSQARHRLRDTPACRAGTLVTLSASQKPFRPFLVNDRGPGALQKKDTARGRPTTDRHRWLARWLASSLARSFSRRGVFTFSGVTASSHAHARRWHGPTTGQETPLSVPPPLPTPPANTVNAGRAGHSGLRKRKYDRDHRQLGKQARIIARSLARSRKTKIGDRTRWPRGFCNH